MNARSGRLWIWMTLFALSVPGAVFAATPRQLADRLVGIRGDVMRLQKDLIDSLKTQQEARSQIKKIRTLLQLQKKERDLGRMRLGELEKTVGELEARRGVIREKILLQRRAMRGFIREMSAASERTDGDHSFESPRRKVLTALVGRGVKAMAELKVDLDDADKLELQIQEERQQLTYLFQDLNEQQSILELNQQLQADLLKKEHQERLSQLENYRKLKTSESQVEHLIGEFNARRELEQLAENEKMSARSQFAKLKGKLSFPVPGKVLSSFGRSFDSTSRLYVFKKGIDIQGGQKNPVRAVSDGKVAYSGDLPNYGQVTIIDHGQHFYSLVANLGELKTKVGDRVAAGDLIGATDDKGTPVYFEIRARNIAVNPLQWVSN